MEPVKGAIVLALLSLASCNDPSHPSVYNMHGKLFCYPIKVMDQSSLTGRTSAFTPMPAFTNDPITKDTPVQQIGYACDWWSQ